jgi:AAA domain-containing protein
MTRDPSAPSYVPPRGVDAAVEALHRMAGQAAPDAAPPPARAARLQWPPPEMAPAPPRPVPVPRRLAAGSPPAQGAPPATSSTHPVPAHPAAGQPRQARPAPAPADQDDRPRAVPPQPDPAPPRPNSPARAASHDDADVAHAGPEQVTARRPARRRRKQAARADAAPETRQAEAPERSARKDPARPPRTRRDRVRPARREPPHDPGLAAEAIAGNLVITAERATAWFRLPLQPWSFRSEAERLAIVAQQAARLAKLQRRRCHLRITSRPYEVATWAAALDQSIRGPFGPDGRPTRAVMPGPCPAHPERSDPSCPSCVPGHAWIDWLKQQQARMRQWGVSERDVYLGVEVTKRGSLKKLAGAWSRAAAAEVASLNEQAARITNLVRGAGLHAEPVSDRDMQWLLVRSCALHMPPPLPVAENPAPVPYALPATASPSMDRDDLAVYTDAFSWSAEPFGPAVKLTRADGLTRHVVVLTVGDFTFEQDLAAESPWMQRTDRLPFPVEWSVVFDVLEPREVARRMARQSDKIRHEYAQFREHSQDPPPALERQLAEVRRIQEDAEKDSGNSPRVFAWPRLAVAGETEQEALDRAGQVTELYNPGITLIKPPDQYRLAREFIPGEPLSSGAHRRSMHAELLVAGAPAVSARVGHRHGFPLGVTTRLAKQAVTFHPWYGMENLNHSGLVTITGTLGAGKSALGGKFGYMSARAGIQTFMLDPRGLVRLLCDIPAIRRHALAVNLLDSPPGTLCPYRLIAEPAPQDFAFDETGARRDPDDAAAAWHKACQAAAVRRKALAADILKMLLPRNVVSAADEKALREAVRRAPGTTATSPRDVIAELMKLTDYGLADVAPLVGRELEGIAEHPLASLFFPAAEDTSGAVIGYGSVLTVMTLRGLVIPGESRKPEERTAEEQLSIPLLHLAAQLLRRLMLDTPRGQRKMVILDEAHALTRDEVGRSQVTELSRDSRKNNTCAVLISQNPGDLLEAGIANLVAASFAGRTEGDAEQEATIRLLGLPPGAGYEARLAELSQDALAGSGTTGEFLVRDGCGGLEQIQIDLGDDPDLLYALNSTPGTAAAAPSPAAAGSRG